MIHQAHREQSVEQSRPILRHGHISAELGLARLCSCPAAGSSCTGKEGLQMLHFNSLSKTSLAIKKILCLEQIEVGEEEHRQ